MLYKLICRFQTGTVSTFRFWVWLTATDWQIKGFCTWPQDRAATISSTSTSLGALRSVSMPFSVWYIVASIAFHSRQDTAFCLSESRVFSWPWMTPVTPLRSHVSPLVHCSMGTEWANIWRRRKGVWFTQPAPAHPLTMSTLHNITHMQHDIKCTYLWECAGFCSYGFTLWGPEITRNKQSCFQENESDFTVHTYFPLSYDCKWVQMLFSLLSVTEKACDQWYAHTVR